MDNCRSCGAERVLNPKTGKHFCKNKCWLQNKPQNAPMGQIERKNDPVDWDRISFGKCKHAFLIEAYKAGLAKDNSLDDIERTCEEWAKRSMRVLEEPRMSPISDQVDQDPF